MSESVRARVTSKGQVTLPKKIRDALDLKESSVVEFQLTDGAAVLRPVGEGFLAHFGTVTPRRRPENWARVRAETMKAVARDSARRGR